MKKILSVITILCLLFTVFTGCKNSKKTKGTGTSTTDPVNVHKTTIGFSIDTLAIERWQRDLDVFMNKAKELGANVIVQNAGNSLEEQNRQLIYLMERNVDAIVVLPKEADGISEALQKIKSRNIPIIAYDRLVLGTSIDLYITINSEQVGELMGLGLKKITRGKKWYCILGPEEDYNMTLVKKGINKALAQTSYSIEHFYHADGWNYDLAYQEMVNILSKDITPDAIICGNDALADSVILALSTYYTGPHIPICGQDADIAACQNIIKGKQDFTIYKPITKLAETAAEIAVQMANGQKADDIAQHITINNNFADIPVVWLEPQLVNTSNIDEVIIESGFHSYNEVYSSSAASAESN